jgi:hypothetical protein
LSARFREPSLSRPQVFPAQDKAVIPAVCVPLNGSGEQTRVRAHPGQIGIERADQLTSSFLKIVTVPEENPVQLSEGFRYPVSRYIAMDDRHEAFVIGRCVRDFPAADLRCDRIGCEHEDECMGGLDCSVDRFLPCVSGRNPFPIDPGFPITTLQFLI